MSAYPSRYANSKTYSEVVYRWAAQAQYS
uniref:Uncharacterized protein n=1 Tax=Anguilla anguilla TaxID=7936 RepID=A0A0E9VCS4_ANGAN